MDFNHICISAKRRAKQRGATLVIFTLAAACVLIPMVGLAIDGSVAFWAKAKLSAAVDAAALAAGRNINTQQSTSQNSGPVAAIATQWFYANFPQGWLGSTVLNGGPSINYITTSSSTQQVTVSATASIPLYFMRVLGQKSITFSAQAQSSRRDSFIVLVLDRSGSMGPLPLGSNACPTMKQDATNFVNLFTENFDTMSLVTFSTTAGPNPDVPPSQVFKSSMTNTISSIACTGATSTAQALAMAYQVIQTSGLAGGLNVIVLFTDGQPNELVADYPIRTQADTRWGLYPPWWGTSAPYTQAFSWDPSTCTGTGPIRGGLSTLVDSSNLQTPASQGMTGGINDTSAQVPVSTAPGLVSSSAAAGCYFAQYGSVTARLDIAYIPTSDLWGNLTNAGYGANSPYYGASVGTISTPDLFTSGPYAGQIRSDEVTTGIMAAAINAADYQAQVIRHDTTYNPVIYAIGLDGAPDMHIDSVLLERIANDQRSPVYDSTRKTGLYAYAPDATQLNQAFQQVAGQILRLSQ